MRVLRFRLCSLFALQKWRTSINRASEVERFRRAVQASSPLPCWATWFAWWLFPLPNSNAIWPQFRSPLEWDVFGSFHLATVSILSAWDDPDLALIRDRAKETGGNIFMGFSMGWRNANNHWRNFEMAYLLLAGCPPLVLSVHTIVSFDLPLPTYLVGTLRFSPYFVAGDFLRFRDGFDPAFTPAVPLWLA